VKKRFFVIVLSVFFVLPAALPAAAREATGEATRNLPTPTPDVYTGAPPEFLYPGLLPDHPLYFLKDLYYRLRTRLVLGLDNQAEWYLKLADKRVAEARELARRGKMDLATRAGQKAVAMQDQAFLRFKKLASEKISEELMEHYRKVQTRQEVVLEALLDRTPPEGKQVVAAMIEKSKAGLRRALVLVGRQVTPAKVSPDEAGEGRGESKIDKKLLEEVKNHPLEAMEIQARLSRPLDQEDQKELGKLMDIEALTEKEAVGTAKGESVAEIAKLPFVSRISLLPKAGGAS
jgi:hypothetical protein